MLELKLEAVTPVLVGGYDTKTSRLLNGTIIRETLRPTSIKGVWRWWARAAVAGAALREKGIFLTLKEEDKLVSDIFGSESNPSKFSIFVEAANEYYLRNFARNLRRIKNPRFMQIGRNYFGIAPGSTFILNIDDRNLDDRKKQFLLSTLALSLFLDGVGKAASRGFGKLVIKEIHPDVYGIFVIDSNIKEYIMRLINLAIESAGEIFEFNEIKGCGYGPCSETLILPKEIPPKEKDTFFMHVYEYPTANVWRLLEWISIAVLKVTEKLYRAKNDRESWKSEIKKPGAEMHTWILGLPRSMEPPLAEENLFEKFSVKIENEKLKKAFKEYFKEKTTKSGRRYRVPTGYYYMKVEDGKTNLKKRRRSPIRFSIYNNKIIMFAFFSRDFEQLDRHLSHISFLGRPDDPFKIKKIEIDRLYESEFYYRLDYLNEVLSDVDFLKNVSNFLIKRY